MTKARLACVLAVLVLCAGGPLSAAGSDLTLVCGRADVFNPRWDAPLTFAYTGDGKGAIEVVGPFGSFSVPATRSPIEIGEGVTGEAIDGIATVPAVLPALADLEACIDKTRDPADENAEDAFLNARDACLRNLEAGAARVEAVAQIRIGLTPEEDDSSGEDAFVVFKLRYAEASRAPGGKMVLEAFPAGCRVGR